MNIENRCLGRRKTGFIANETPRLLFVKVVFSTIRISNGGFV